MIGSHDSTARFGACRRDPGRRPRGAAAGPDDRPLRDRVGAGPGRLRHHLPRARRPARPRGGDQGIPADGAGDAPGSAPRCCRAPPRWPRISAGDASASSPRAARWRACIACRRSCRSSISSRPTAPPTSSWSCCSGETLEERIKRQRQAGRRGRRPHPVAAARRAGAGPQCRLPASRHQARQHPARRRGQPDADRFRRLARGDGGPQHGAHRHLHAGLRRGRADDLGQAGSVDRHLRPVGHALSRHHRPDAAQRLRPHAGRWLRAARPARAGRLFTRRAGGRRCRPRGGRPRPAADHRRLAADPRHVASARRG